MTTDRVAGLALVLIGVYTLWESRVLPLGSLRAPGPAFLPMVLALVLVGLGALVAAGGRSAPRLRTLHWAEAGHAVAILGACAFAALALERLGYRLTMALVLLFLLRVVERKPAALALGFAVAGAALSFHLFHTLLRVPLPRGPLGL